MESRDQRVYEEASALWRELFAEPPPVRADERTMLEIITSSLAETTYDRLRSPYLRPATIAGPAQPRTRARLA